MLNTPLQLTQTINQLEWFIQTDLGDRGFHQIPGDNLCTHTQGNLYKAVKFLAENPGCEVGIATGFYIPTANPPAPDNDGPPGALIMARGLHQLGYPIVLFSDRYCLTPLQQGIEIFKDHMNDIKIVEFPFELKIPEKDIIINRKWYFSKLLLRYVRSYFINYPQLRCLISIERVGPCHIMNSFLGQPPIPNKRTIGKFNKEGPGDLKGECLNMNGIPVTEYIAPIEVLFEYKFRAKYPIFTIGIGDGGNEIGMGSIPWSVIAKNITNRLGGKIACRVPTDATIVAGVSNWAGYALIAGLYFYLNRVDDFLRLYSEKTETKLITNYFQTKSAIDGKLGYPAMSVDGIDWGVHLEILEFIKTIVRYGIDR